MRSSSVFLRPARLALLPLLTLPPAFAWLACGTSGDTPTDAGAPRADGTASPLPLPLPPGDGGASVLQHHNHVTRDGLYIDPAITRAAARTMHVTGTWDVSPGPTYAAPLFLDGVVGGKDVAIVATEPNVVFAFDVGSRAVVWKNDALGAAVPLSALHTDPGCGNIDPLGITGTPVIDVAARALYLDAMTTPDHGATKKHLVYALSIDDGHVLPGWPVDVEAALASSSPAFTSKLQNQRGALLVQDGVLYVPYGGHAGDCGDYRGWIVGIDVATRDVKGWATPGLKAGSWAVAGVSSDGTSVYITTGNTSGAQTWAGGEAVLRFTRGPVFSGDPADYYSPANWQALDSADLDLGGSAAVVADVPGATPSALIVALGKDGNVYLIDRASLGGVGHEVAKKNLSSSVLNGAAAVYTTPSGTYVTFRANAGHSASCPDGRTGNVLTVRIGATAPPTIDVAWCSDRADLAAPIASVSSASGTDAIVWVPAQTGELLGYDGETGEVLLGGGGGSGSVHYFETAIVAKGRVFVAGKTALVEWGP